jgi:hypothetical protein
MNRRSFILATLFSIVGIKSLNSIGLFSSSKEPDEDLIIDNGWIIKRSQKLS